MGVAMSDLHLTDEDFQRLVGGTLDRDPVAAVIHVIVCPECASRFERATGHRGLTWLRCRFSEIGPVTPETLETGASKLAGRFTVLTSREVEQVVEAAALADELRGLPRRVRLLRAANLRRYRSLALGEELLRRARALWRWDPWKAEGLAETAVAVFKGLVLASKRRLPHIEDSLASAWGALANARRVQGRLRDARETLNRAAVHLEGGTGADEDAAFWHRHNASLMAALRRFKQAADSCHAARRAFLRAGLFRDAVWMEVQHAIVESKAGRLDRGMQLYERFLATYSQNDVGEEIHRLARQNMAVALAELGHGADARSLFEDLTSQEEGWDPDPVSKLRVRWTEGLILEAENRPEEATTVLTRVQEAFSGRGLDYDVALASLDVVRLRLRLGDSAYVRAVASGLQTYFRAKGIHREAAKARQYLADALEA